MSPAASPRASSRGCSSGTFRASRSSVSLAVALIASCAGPASRPAADLVLQSGHREFPVGAAFSADGATLQAAGADGSIVVWDVRTGRSIRAIPLPSPARALAATRSRLIIAGTPTVSLDPRIRFDGGRTDAVVAATDDIVATGAIENDGRILLWSPAGDRVAALEGHEWGVTALAFSADGRTLASAGKDGELRLWSMESKISSKPILLGDVNALVFHGDKVFAATDQGLQVADPAPRVVLKGKHSLVASGGGIVAVAGEGVTLLDGDGRRLHHFETGPLPTALAFSRDGSMLAVGTAYRTLQVFDVARRTLLRTLRSSFARLHAVVAHPTQPTLHTLMDDDRLVRWDLSTGRCSAFTHCTGSLAVHRDRVAVMRTGTNAPEDGILRLVNPAAATHGLKFSPDGSRLYGASASLTAEAGGIAVWDGRTGAFLERLADDDAEAIAISPDGAVAAIAIPFGRIRLWDLAGRKVAGKFDAGGPVRALAFSPDGTLLASGGGRMPVRLHRVATGEVVAELGSEFVNDLRFDPSGRLLMIATPQAVLVHDVASRALAYRVDGHSVHVWQADFADGGRLLVAGGWDGSLEIREAETGRLVATATTLDGIDGVIVTPDNHYLAGRGALDLVAFRVGDRVFPFEQFDLALHRPDLVLERLGCSTPAILDAHRAAVRRRRARSGFTEESMTLDAPDVRISGLPAPSIAESSIRFRVKARDDRADLDRLSIWVNDVPVPGSRGIDLRPLGARTHERDITIDLEPGRNKIQVSAHNVRGGESLRETFEVVSAAPATEPRLVLLAVGVSRYADARLDLRYASSDARAFAAAMERVWPGAAVRLITDREATRERILASRDFLMASRRGDLVAVYLAGHGILDGSLTYHFGATDVDFDRPAKRGLTFADLDGLLDGLPSRHKVLLVDTCRAGDVDPPEPPAKEIVVARDFGGLKVASSRTEAAAAMELVRDFFADLRRGSGTVVLAAAGGREYARERNELSCGVFTSVVLEALERDEIRTATQLRDYVVPAVRRLTGGGQTPAMRGESIEFDVELKPRRP